MATYGAAVYQSTQAEINTLRGIYTQALWPKKYVACRTTGLLLVDKGEIEPGVKIVNKVLVRHVRGPINYFITTIKQLNWIDNSPTNITDHMGFTRGIDDWQSLVYDGIKRARHQAWEKSARNIHTSKGMERGVDEVTTSKHYLKPAQKEPITVGALHTIIADGVWTPQRAHKRQKNSNGQ
eukprot:16141436-Heterocapsa_arctica.AAC.1